MKKFLSSILALAMVLSLLVGTAIFANAAEGNVAKIGDTYYTELSDAIAAAQNGDTIEVLTDIELPKYLYVGQDEAKEIVIDLGNNTISSTGRVLVAYREGTKLTVQNGTVIGGGSTGSLVATYNGTLILGENLTVKNNTACAVYVNEGKLIAKEDSILVEGVKKAINVKGEYDIQIYAGSYSSVLSTSFIPEGYISVKHDDGTYGVVCGEANIGSKGYATLKEAIAAAQNGDVIKLAKNVTLTTADAVMTSNGYTVMLNIDNDVTLDLNGYTIDVEYDSNELLYAVVFVADGAKLTVNDTIGEGGINLTTGDTKADEYDCVAYMFWKHGTEGSLVVNGGNFHANKVEDSLVYTNGSHIVTVNGGSFILDNTHSQANGAPWIFNTTGQNEKKITITGGSFNADVFHQYWIFETTAAKELALQYNKETGMYTVVDAVAYVTERHWSGKWYTKNVGYATLEDAMEACEGIKIKTIGKNTYKSKAEEVMLLQNFDVIYAQSNVIINGNGFVVGCVNLNGANNVTLKGITFDAAGAKMAIGGNGKNRYPANIIGRDSSNKSVAGARGVVIEGCTFSGEFVDGGMAICFSDQTKAQSGDITIKDCKFATTGGYVDIYTYYAGWGELIIEGNTFASVTLDYPIYLGKYQSATPVVVKGNTFENKASFDAAAYIQDHSNYGVSFDAADNTFNG